MVKQSNKQTTKVIVKIGTDVVKRKRTYKRKTKSKKEEQVQPRPVPVPQSFGTLSAQNTALNSFSSNIQNSLQNILKNQSDLNSVVNQLRAQQRPEENEGQNAQIVNNLNLDNDRPIDYQALLQPEGDGKEEFVDYSELGIPPKQKDYVPDAPELQEPPASASSSDPLTYFRRPRNELEEYEALTGEEEQKVNDYYSNLEKEAKKAGKKPKQRQARSKVRKDDQSPYSRELSEIVRPYQIQIPPEENQ